MGPENIETVTDKELEAPEESELVVDNEKPASGVDAPSSEKKATLKLCMVDGPCYESDLTGGESDAILSLLRDAGIIPAS